MSKKFITYRKLVDLGIFNNRMTLKRAMENHGFPRPYQLGERRQAWDEAAVDAWVAARESNVVQAGASR